MRKIVAIASDNSDVERLSALANYFATALTLEPVVLSGDVKMLVDSFFVDCTSGDQFAAEQDVALFAFSINEKSNVRKYLNATRSLRVPYFFLKSQADFNLNRIVLPITNMPEEREKVPFAVALAKHFHADITIYQPNDYGTRAEQNITFAANVFDSSSLTYNITKGKKDSYKIEYEAMSQNNSMSDSMLIISASREYGLDDIIFGPKELKILNHSNIPVLVINPRGDLYLLCD